MAGVENLSQFDLDGAENFVLVETRADGLSDLGEQFVFFGAAVGVVADDVVLEREAELQREADHQARTGGAEGATLGVRKQDDAEIVFARLQIDRRQMLDVRPRRECA